MSVVETPLAERTQLYWQFSRYLRDPNVPKTAKNNVAVASGLESLVTADLSQKLLHRVVEASALAKKKAA